MHNYFVLTKEYISCNDFATFLKCEKIEHETKTGLKYFLMVPQIKIMFNLYMQNTKHIFYTVFFLSFSVPANLRITNFL